MVVACTIGRICILAHHAWHPNTTSYRHHRHTPADAPNAPHRVGADWYIRPQCRPSPHRAQRIGVALMAGAYTNAPLHDDTSYTAWTSQRPIRRYIAHGADIGSAPYNDTSHTAWT